MKPKRLLWLGAAGVASFGLYLFLALRYPLMSSLDNQRASWATQVSPTAWNAALHLTIYLGVTLLYMVVLYLLAGQRDTDVLSRRRQYAVIVLVWLACSVILMAVAPGGESHDIFDYIFRGRMMAEYQANPLNEVPNDFGPSTPFTRYLAWRKSVDTYGPLWEGASAALAVSVRGITRWLHWWGETFPACPKSFDSCRLLIAYITSYRLFAVAISGVIGWTIATMVRRAQPVLAPLALGAWLLNPMTLMASAVGGHNDSLMLALAVFCWWLLQRSHPYLGLLALILAAHVKLTALIWLPTIGLWILWRWGWKQASRIGLAAIISGLVISWLMYAPFGGWCSLPRMLHERSLYLANSPWRILRTLLVERWDWTAKRSRLLSIRLANGLFAIGALLIPVWVFRLWSKQQRGDLVPEEEADQLLWRALTATSVLFLLLGSFWFQHWYVLWAIAPATLLAGNRFTRSILPWLGFGALSANLVMDFLSVTMITKDAPVLSNTLAVGLIWGPAIVAAVVEILGKRFRRSMVQARGA